MQAVFPDCLPQGSTTFDLMVAGREGGRLWLVRVRRLSNGVTGVLVGCGLALARDALDPP